MSQERTLTPSRSESAAAPVVAKQKPLRAAPMASSAADPKNAVRKNTTGPKPIPIEKRFWPKVKVGAADECWPWIGAHDQHGRGQIWFDGKHHRAPRISLFLKNGVMPSPSKDACHTCDNPSCVNPAHLWEGTPTENALDAKAKGKFLHFNQRSTAANFNKCKSHCVHGHEFAPENTLRNKAGERQCRICQRDNAKNRRDRIRAKALALTADTQGGSK